MTTTAIPPTDTPVAPLDERIFAAATACFELAAVHLGARLGWYRALAGAPASAPELAERTGTDPRYAREWLEQQAVAGYLVVEDAAAEPDARRYHLPAEHVGVLVDELSPSYLAPLAHQALAFTRNVDRLVAVYRSGGGLGWAEMGADARESQAALNRPYYLAYPVERFRCRTGGRVDHGKSIQRSVRRHT
jgi:hypothetical protein